VLKLRALMLLGLCFAAPAKAGLFADDDARAQIQQLEARVQQYEARVRVLEDASKQQVKSMLDLQSQIEALNGEIRKLRGQNEEIAHGLQDAEKRQKDFYVDLDTRVRHFESAEEAAKEAAEKAAKEAVSASAVSPAANIPADLSDPAPENRAFEAAYGMFKGGNHANAIKSFQDFIKKYPDSVHVSNANYWLGKSQFALKNYNGALKTYEGLLADFPDTPKAADALLDIAACQQGLKRPVTARKTLKQLIAKYPASEAAAKAKKLLATK
jgi:tol-pal system protein YbgF